MDLPKLCGNVAQQQKWIPQTGINVYFSSTKSIPTYRVFVTTLCK